MNKILGIENKAVNGVPPIDRRVNRVNKPRARVVLKVLYKV